MEAACDDAAALIASVHGSAFRALSNHLDADVQGLTIAARLARKRGLLSAGLARRLERLDIAFAVSRHINKKKGKDLLGELYAELQAPGSLDFNVPEAVDSGAPSVPPAASEHPLSAQASSSEAGGDMLAWSAADGTVSSDSDHAGERTSAPTEGRWRTFAPTELLHSSGLDMKRALEQAFA
eukprot:9802902-Alexandrium_andersonii.AAC.1